MDARGVARDFFGASIKQDVNAVLFENFRDGFRNVAVFTSEQAIRGLNHSNFAIETPKELAELEPDITAAENEEMFGNDVQFHDGRAVEKGDVVEARDLWHGGAATGVDEKTISGESAVLALFVAHGGKGPRGKLRGARDSGGDWRPFHS